jgi:hypothetical protein
MIRKRVLKKQQKRQESALAQLEDLYRRGADDEFLARAAEQVRDLSASPLAAQWAEAADRALRQSLARADLGRLERLLTSLRRGGPLRPLAVLAEAVLDLAAGRLEAARSRLAGLESSAAALPQGLLAVLRSLAQERPDSWLLDDPCLQAAGEFFRALQNPEIDRQTLARSLEAMRAAAPRESGDLGRLLDSAGRCLSLLADLDALEQKLEKDEGSQTSQQVSAWLHGPGPRLAAALAASGPPLLAPLQHAVRLRWRAVLELVAAQEGSPGLAALCAADPKLLGCDVSLPGGSLADLRHAAQARQLLAAHRYGSLARLLRSRGEAETESGTLAALWSLELWAANRRSSEEEADEDDGRADLPEPPTHRTLVRLQQMAGEISRRFPPEQRAEVAAELRRELFNLCEQSHFCEHVARAALSLLEHQPGDFGLLVAGIAGSVAGRDSRTLRAIEAGLARRGMAQAGDLDIAQRLIAQVVLESSESAARILKILRPFLAGHVWPEIAALAAREMSEKWPDALARALFESLRKGRSESRAFNELQRDLDHLRPVLAGTSGFAAMELALDCWRPNPPDLEKRLKKFLADVPSLEGALTAFLLLRRTMSFVEPGSARTIRGRLARAVIERLDDRWQLWAHAVGDLAISVRSNHLPQLEEKIQQILASPGMPPSGRQILEKGLGDVRHVLRLRGPSRRRKSPSSQPARKKPPRRAGAPQLQLDI